MDALLLAAAVLLFFIGVVHSVLGEKLIFIRLRSRIKDQTSLDLSERHVRILWVSWHLVTLFGLVLVTVLVMMARGYLVNETLKSLIFCILVIASLMVLIMTKARHPAWMGLLLVAILIAMS